MTEEVRQIRVGDLLAEAGILSSDYISSALKNFEQRGLPIGKVLVLSGYLTDGQLRTALQVQSMVNDGLLPINVATQVLACAHRDNIPLSEAFARSGFVQPEDRDTNKLGKLLVDAQVVTSEQLEDSLQTNARTGLPLGHIFCFRDFVSQALVDRTLLAQHLVRRGVVARADAIKGLKAAHERERQLKRVEINRGYHRTPTHPCQLLGEMLNKARLINEPHLEEAMKRSIVSGKFLGEELIESGHVSQEVIDAGVELQEMLDNGTFKSELANEVLLLVGAKKMPFFRAVAEVGTFSEKSNKSELLVETLTLSGFLVVSRIPREIQEKTRANYNEVPQVCELLLKSGVEEKMLFSALRCVYLINEQFLNLHQAIMALDFSQRANLTIDQAMYQLGWTMRTRLRQMQEEPESPT